MGEILVEVMRPRAEMPLNIPGEFLGPYPSGAPAIFIDTAARLGHKAVIVGGVGDDDFGRCLLDRLSADGVICDHITIDENLSTAVAFVTYFNNGDRKFIFHMGNTAAANMSLRGLSVDDKPDFFHIMGCSLTASDGFHDNIIPAIELFRNSGAAISFDPNIRPELLKGKDLTDLIEPVLDACSVFLPGADELLCITGADSIETAVEGLFARTPIEYIAVKKGRAGCSVFSRREHVDYGIFDIEPRDPTGAGDCFDAAFICGLLENKTLVECAGIATAAASLNTAAFGPMEGNISRDSVYEMIARQATGA